MNTALFLLLFAACCYNSQPALIGGVGDCLESKQLQFSEKDTCIVFLKAKYLSIGRVAGNDEKIIYQIPKSYKLKAESFTYAIEFEIENCQEKLYVPSDNTEMMDTLHAMKPGKALKLKCIFFKKYNTNGAYFFIIDDVKVI